MDETAWPPEYRLDAKNPFHRVLIEMVVLHDRKSEDYGADEDPLANIRSSEQAGVPAWLGALIRLNDKVHRLFRFAKKGRLANEGARDSMIDIAVYGAIMVQLHDENKSQVENAFHETKTTRPIRDVPQA